MPYTKVVGEPGRIVVCSLTPGSELTESIIEICREEGIDTAIVLSFIGTVNELYLRNPRDTTQLPVTNEEEFSPEIDTVVLRRRMEILSIEGNITTFEGKLFLNLHGIFSEAGGIVRGGHIFRATIWTQAEVFIQEIRKVRLTRERDLKVTGLPQIRLHQLD
jgi:predicted DNA-binding protein with PD1-like motif